MSGEKNLIIQLPNVNGFLEDVATISDINVLKNERLRETLFSIKEGRTFITRIVFEELDEDDKIGHVSIEYYNYFVEKSSMEGDKVVKEHLYFNEKDYQNDLKKIAELVKKLAEGSGLVTL